MLLQISLKIDYKYMDLFLNCHFYSIDHYV